MSTSAHHPTVSIAGEPTWEIAELFPYQGAWSEADYFELETNCFVELSDGILEVLPSPTTSHQLYVLQLFKDLDSFVTKGNLGLTLLGPLPLRLREGKIREPDLLFCFWRNRKKIGEKFWTGADLLIEVVSEGGEKRDLEIKREEYARAGVSEYWIVEPQFERITILRLRRSSYDVAGEFSKGDRAASLVLSGFDVDVAEVFAAGKIAE